MASRSFVATLDPVDPKVRTAAKRLAARLDDDSEVGQVVRSLLADIAAARSVTGVLPRSGLFAGICHHARASAERPGRFVS